MRCDAMSLPPAEPLGGTRRAMLERVQEPGVCRLAARRGETVAVAGLFLDDVDAGEGLLRAVVRAAHGRVSLGAPRGLHLEGGPRDGLASPSRAHVLSAQLRETQCPRRGALSHGAAWRGSFADAFLPNDCRFLFSAVLSI